MSMMSSIDPPTYPNKAALEVNASIGMTSHSIYSNNRDSEVLNSAVLNHSNDVPSKSNDLNSTPNDSSRAGLMLIDVRNTTPVTNYWYEVDETHRTETSPDKEQRSKTYSAFEKSEINEENKNQCTVCQKIFSNSYKLRRHSLTHSGTTSHQCSVCRKSFISPYDLKRHVRRHPGAVIPDSSKAEDINGHSCDQCGKTFSSTYKLKRHQLTHGAIGSFRCDQCSKFFTSNYHLARHSKVHSKEEIDRQNTLWDETGVSNDNCQFGSWSIANKEEAISQSSNGDSKTSSWGIKTETSMTNECRQENQASCPNEGERETLNKRENEGEGPNQSFEGTSAADKSHHVPWFPEVKLKSQGEAARESFVSWDAKMEALMAHESSIKKEAEVARGPLPEEKESFWAHENDGQNKLTEILTRFGNNHFLVSDRNFTKEIDSSPLPEPSHRKVQNNLIGNGHPVPRLHDLSHENEAQKGKHFWCDTCGKTFMDAYKLRRHSLIHSGSSPHQCDVCHRCFIGPYDLKRHKLVHSSERPYVCQHCGKGFIRASCLSDHELVHSRTMPFRCQLCNKGFVRPGQYKKHQLSHQGTDSSDHDAM